MIDAIQRFHAFHDQGQFLLLGNAWDRVSARVWENAGAAVIGTSSSAVAWANGASDGQKLGWDRMRQAILDIAEHVNIPVSADIENGFSDDAVEVADRIMVLKQAGIVGINMEDGAADAEQQSDKINGTVKKIQATRKRENGDGSSIFINSRTDLFLLNEDHREDMVDAAIEISRRYADAGADGFFAPGLVKPAFIERLAKACPLPVNIYALPGLPHWQELAELGVRRLSVGCAPLQAFMKQLGGQATAYLAGEGDPFSNHMLPYPEAAKIAGRSVTD